jgi:DNA ligase D-like protein (predicted 3'-phosphoesterase)
MAREDELAAYREKRDFDRTREPSGGPRGDRDQPIFVVQQHDASTMHWDFRLEADGVLKSWSVPKGPSVDPRDKRLAVPTEDHPLDYADFEGLIPSGEYGAGPVVVWDAGPYENLTTGRGGDEVPVGAAVERGHVTFRLHGEKLQGAWSLTRMKGRGGWLLVKKADAGADARRRPTRTQPESVRTGRTVDAVRADESEGAEQSEESDGEDRG